jgi:hypothetical protein
MCELHQARGDVEEFKRTVYAKRDPHAAYRPELDRKVA